MCAESSPQIAHCRPEKKRTILLIEYANKKTRPLLTFPANGQAVRRVCLILGYTYRPAGVDGEAVLSRVTILATHIGTFPSPPCCFRVSESATRPGCKRTTERTDAQLELTACDSGFQTQLDSKSNSTQRR